MIKTFFKSLTVAFSIYSKIPVPRFNWATEDMKYHLCFFPWVGALIGALEYGWFKLFSAYFGGPGSDSLALIHKLFFSLIALVIPFLITGGFHVDGFLDTMDALHSYGDREKKLGILKDPHVGAFALISFAVFLMLALAFTLEINSERVVISLSLTFFISRCLSGLSVLLFPKAKSDGMLVIESGTKKPVFVIITLLLQLTVGIWALLFFTTFFGGFSFWYFPFFFILFLYFKKTFWRYNGRSFRFFCLYMRAVCPYSYCIVRFTKCNKLT